MPYPFMPYGKLQYGIISYYIISFYITLPHHTLQHLVPSHIISSLIRSYHITCLRPALLYTQHLDEGRGALVAWLGGLLVATHPGRRPHTHRHNLSQSADRVGVLRRGVLNDVLAMFARLAPLNDNPGAHEDADAELFKSLVVALT